MKIYNPFNYYSKFYVDKGKTECSP